GRIPAKEAHGLEPAPPPHVERRLANDAEEPGSHRGPTVVARAPIQDFEVCRLQHVLSLLPPEATACQRPAVARRVKPFDLSLERRHFLGDLSRQKPFHMTRPLFYLCVLNLLPVRASPSHPCFP